MLKYRLIMAGLVAVATLATGIPISADATIPTADRRGSKDHPSMKRYDGSFIVSYDSKAFAEFELPTSPLVEVEGKRDRHNNRYHEPRNKKALEGPYTRLAYLIPENRSPLEVLRNYQDEIKARGGTVLFTCKDAECGGDPTRSTSGGGGDMSLAMFLYPIDRITDTYVSNGYCALTEHISDQRYLSAELPAQGTHISVLVYTLVVPNPSDGCRAFNGRTIAVVDIIDGKARENKMVAVNAGEMASAISSSGRVALYGILFDFNKTDIKPESDPTLEQMAKLLKDSPALKLLVVGHTDNIGGFASNMDLSQRRAAAVVAALNTRYGIAKDRLSPVGVSFASPVASNKTDDGRAKNRRVELVDNATTTTASSRP
jgi:OmpA-OmpF porin, OOP family